jgi:6-pyruvoyltetrahydropterin/6-carboxytetrahydropterin synthase
MSVAQLIRRVRFAAAHRYRKPEWTEEKNVEVFGLCARPNYHGHNYACSVTVEGTIDPVTGMVIDLERLDRVLESRCRFDHRNITSRSRFADGGLIPPRESGRFILDRFGSVRRGFGSIGRIDEDENLCGGDS